MPREFLLKSGFGAPDSKAAGVDRDPRGQIGDPPTAFAFIFRSTRYDMV